MEEPTRPRAQYQRVAWAIEDGISDGTYPVGSRLPANRALADQFGVSHMTIKQALTILVDAGIVASRRGVPAEVLAVPSSREHVSMSDRLSRVERQLEALSERIAVIEDHASDPTANGRTRP